MFRGYGSISCRLMTRNKGITMDELTGWIVLSVVEMGVMLWLLASNLRQRNIAYTEKDRADYYASLLDRQDEVQKWEQRATASPTE